MGEGKEALQAEGTGSVKAQSCKHKTCGYLIWRNGIISAIVKQAWKSWKGPDSSSA